MYDPGPDYNTGKCIPLHRNENLFVDAGFLENLVVEQVRNSTIFSYPQSSSYDLRAAIGKYHACSADEVYVGNGADGVLADLFNYLREYYDEIGFQDFTYQVYPFLCERYNFHKKKLNETNKIWVIDSPNAINGGVFDFKAVEKYPEYLIWDNVYGQYDSQNELTCPHTANYIRVHSFSKFFGLASLRIGYCIGNKGLISTLLARKDIFNVNTIAQKTAIAALTQKDYFQSLLPQVVDSKKMLTKSLEELGFIVTKGRANFIWVTHSNLKMSDLQNELAKKGILVRRFEVENLQNYLRITLPSLQIVDKLVMNIKHILEKIS